MKKILSKIASAVDIIRKIEDVPIFEINRIPNSCGAYIITFESGKIYVGKSKNVRTRPLQHQSKSADEFRGEKMKKVSAYLTNNYKDAGVLEALLIRELPVINREHQEDASTWKEVPLNKHLVKGTKDIQNIFLETSRKICCIGPDVKEIHRNEWTTYQISAGKNFCIIWIKRNYLRIELKVDKNNFHDPYNLSKEIEWTTTQAFNRRIEMHNEEQSGAILNLIVQAYQSISRKK